MIVGVGSRARHRGRHPARVLGGRGRGRLPPARRRRGRRAAPCPTGSDVDDLRRRRPGPGPPRGRPLRLRRLPRRRRRPAGRDGRGGAWCSSPGSSPRCSCRRCRAARSAGPPAPSGRAALFFDGDGAPPPRRPVPRRRARLPRRRLPRRHQGRPRQHLRRLRRRHQDQLRDLPALRALPLGRAGRRGPQHQGARLQRQGRGPALPRPPQRAARRRAGGPLRSARAAHRRVRLARASGRRHAATTPSAAPDVGSRVPGRAQLLLVDPRLLRPGAAAVPVRRRRGRPPAVHDGRPQRDRRAGPRGQGHRRRRGRHRHPRRRRSSATSTRSSAPSRTGCSPRRRPRAVGGTGHRRRHRQRVHPPPRRRVRHVRAPRPGRRRPPRRPTRVGFEEPGHRRRHPQPQRPGQALRRRRHPAQGVRGQGALGPGPAAAVRGARRAQQVRAARRLEPDQGDPARRRRARPLARHRADRLPADGQRGRAPRHRQLRDPGRRPARRRRGRPGRVRLPARRCSASGPRSSSRARCSCPSPGCRCRCWSSSRSRRGRPAPPRRRRRRTRRTPPPCPDDPLEGLPT